VQTEYMVCQQAAIDANGNCTQVQYVQAPTMLPPMGAACGAAIAVAIWGVWALAAVWRTLGK
jgi:LDH2 family malate/lactate/ureidoglycolate dehydrogenase